MGATSLRRYHAEVAKPKGKAPEFEAGILATQDATVEDTDKANAAKLHDEQAAQRGRSQSGKSTHPVIRKGSQQTKAAKADPTVDAGTENTAEGGPTTEGASK